MLRRMHWMRARRDRILLIPDQWSGTVQQFYHFLLGYLAPVVLWQARTRVTEVTVRDCGPMNRWWSLLDHRVDIEIVSPGDALHLLAGDRQPHVILRGMDYPEEFDGHRLRRFADIVTESIDRSGDAAKASQGAAEPRVTVIDRATSDPFYRTRASEIDLSGRLRRSIPNLSVAIAATALTSPPRIVELAHEAPVEQIRTLRETDILVGQHGAGLTSMVWMPPGSSVVEIHPPLPDEVRPVFPRLAAALGIRHTMVPQSGVHAPIDPRDLDDALAVVMTHARPRALRRQVTDAASRP